MNTIELTLTDPADWVAVATGPGLVTSTPHTEQPVAWQTQGAGAADLQFGHRLVQGVDRTFDLLDGETLYLRGNGVVALTPENGVAL